MLINQTRCVSFSGHRRRSRKLTHAITYLSLQIKQEKDRIKNSKKIKTGNFYGTQDIVYS